MDVVRIVRNSPQSAPTCVELESGTKIRSIVLEGGDEKDNGESMECAQTLTILVNDAAMAGRWCCIALDISSSAPWLRSVVRNVWCKGHWDYHPQFLCWIAVEEEQGDNGTLVDLQAWVTAHAYYLMSASAIIPRFRPDDLLKEFQVRELLSAMQEGAYYRVATMRPALLHFFPHHVIDALRLVMREDVFLVTFDSTEQPFVNASKATEAKTMLPWLDCPVSATTRACIESHIAHSRDLEGYSALDVAIGKDYRMAAIRLRNLGCRTERFDFNRLLSPCFAPMLQVLLDPEQPLPFDAVESAARIAASGRVDLLRRLFQCGADVHFVSRHYPLVHAVMRESKELVHCVVDRMSATGVHPFRNGHEAAYHANEIVTRAWMSPEMDDDSSSDSTSGRFNECAVWVLSSLLRAIVDDDIRVSMPLAYLRRLQQYPELMTLALKGVSLKEFSTMETPALLRFFISFDPSNPVAIQLVEKAADDIVTEGAKMGGDTMEVKTLELVRLMVSCGDGAISLLARFVDRVAPRGQLNYLLRDRVTGGSILTACFEQEPINIQAATVLLAGLRCQELKAKVLCQPDTVGSDLLHRFVMDTILRPARLHTRESYAGVLWLLEQLDALMPRETLPSVTTKLFTLCERHTLGYLVLGIAVFQRRSKFSNAAAILRGTTVETRSVVVNAALDVASTGVDSVTHEACAEQLVLLDPRIGVGTASTLSVPFPILCAMFHFLPAADKANLARCCVRFSFAFLSDWAWLEDDLFAMRRHIVERETAITSQKKARRL